jgi:3-oxoacyl-[acyl-carrier protein] reductase
MRLQDKVAIITGAGQGIGKAYARRFLEEGARVVIAEIDEQRGKSALEELADLGDVRFIPTDVASEDATVECARRVVEELGRIDVLINNAALYYDIDNRDNSLAYLQRVFSINQHGALLMTRACAPQMVAQGAGRVIMQASGAAYTYVIPPMGSGTFRDVSSFAYSQTKWGVIGLTKFLAGQLGRHGITVNCISPGVTMTEATKKVVPENLLGAVTFMTAMQRTLEPEDLAGAAVFFASDDAGMVTGQVLCVDGGMHMPA